MRILRSFSVARVTCLLLVLTACSKSSDGPILPAASATDTNPAIGPATGSAAATQTAPPQATETISPSATISATETYVPAQPAVIRNPAPLRDVIAAGT